ncbi:non-hydrolyzing UDP-N-acetylglucosamine 2-epimerase [Parapedobacter sp. DT-150]|uniref:non-hydrolyzing UDP-N-acetylglucosamine 2-epimerase n=1 Tax=Parapedobacter sp. DT-150 TaxID=3396162 RepID=UPI003F19B0AB
MKKILVVFGTRPEAIKMAPVIKAIQQLREMLSLEVCVTAQHRHMLDQVLSFFEISPDYDLDLMRTKPDLFGLTAGALVKMKEVLETSKPDYVLVHGDTTTSMAASLAAYYMQIPVGHVEAGLRTYDRYAPFPEEINRQLTGRIASLHFAPTTRAKQNLMNEGVAESQIHVTGNTVIDALNWAKERLGSYYDKEIETLRKTIRDAGKIMLVTAHRRENHGNGIIDICKALSQIARRKDVTIVFPVHLNPEVRVPVYDLLGNLSNVVLLEPLGYPAFTWLMLQSHVIMTDSGGIQEEGPSLGKPVLVMREISERPEAIAAGVARLVGTNPDNIFNEVTALLDNADEFNKMTAGSSPYGDGHSGKRIANILLNH